MLQTIVFLGLTAFWTGKPRAPQPPEDPADRLSTEVANGNIDFAEGTKANLNPNGALTNILVHVMLVRKR